jgi:hypothetical protein
MSAASVIVTYAWGSSAITYVRRLAVVEVVATRSSQRVTPWGGRVPSAASQVRR